MDPSLFDVNMTHYCLVMVDNKYKWMNSKVVPLLSWDDALWIELSYKYGQRTHDSLWNNEMKVNEFINETILDGQCFSFYFLWYVERHITPHSQRVMDM